MDRSLHGWAENYGVIDKQDKVGMFDTDIQADFKRLEKSGLPTYKRLILEPIQFLLNKNYYVQNFKYESYYAQVYPMSTGLKKYNLMGFNDLEDIVPFLSNNIKGLYDKYLLLISEFEPNVFGGSVMSDGKSVKIDMVRGLQNQISYGKAADCSCIVDANSNIEFSCSGKLEKRLFFEILDSLRIYNDEDKYMKGYFEFAFTSKSGTGSLRLVYFDYKKQSFFYN